MFVNNRNAAHVELSLGRCEKYPAPVQVAEGSSNVFISSVATARKGDRLTCGARISSGSDDVFIGGAES
ncbi:PAAR domain-containing protein [Pseudomonas graminis]|uniref:PAAR domain-containing protein n=1 Tax=Pseudomonas graminis TaxID=158627 RepID=UPI003C25E951